MKVLAPFGFYGWGNIGDESTLQGFASLVRQHGRLRVSVASQNPLHTARVEPSFDYFRTGAGGFRAWWARQTANAHVFAGGTPIMDNLGDWPLTEVVPLVRAAARARVPVAYVGVGVETLRQESSRRLVASELAPHVSHWSVRGQRDRDRLIELGVPAEKVTAAADMAWLLRSVDTTFGRERLARLKPATGRPLVVGVNINLERAMVQVQPQLTRIVAAALDRLVESFDAEIVFLCNEVREGATFDKAAAQAVLGDMKQRDRAWMVPNEYFTPQEMLSLIGCCHLTISSRYHFCLFSALQGVPFLAINRSDKVEDLCLDLELQGLRLAELETERLYRAAGCLYERREPTRTALAARVDALRRRALGNLRALESLTA
jgi:polysaccharide pyruvyl transferase WcaK-like protein